MCLALIIFVISCEGLNFTLNSYLEKYKIILKKSSSFAHFSNNRVFSGSNSPLIFLILKKGVVLLFFFVTDMGSGNAKSVKLPFFVTPVHPIRLVRDSLPNGICWVSEYNSWLIKKYGPPTAKKATRTNLATKKRKLFHCI